MDSRIVLFLAIAVTSCLCLPEPGPWTLKPSCPCGRVYLPVCGWDGAKYTTYSNKCEFDCTASFYQYFFGKPVQMVKEDDCGELDKSGKTLN